MNDKKVSRRRILINKLQERPKSIDILNQKKHYQSNKSVCTSSLYNLNNISNLMNDNNINSTNNINNINKTAKKPINIKPKIYQNPQNQSTQSIPPSKSNKTPRKNVPHKDKINIKLNSKIGDLSHITNSNKKNKNQFSTDENKKLTKDKNLNNITVTDNYLSNNCNPSSTSSLYDNTIIKNDRLFVNQKHKNYIKKNKISNKCSQSAYLNCNDSRNSVQINNNSMNIDRKNHKRNSSNNSSLINDGIINKKYHQLKSCNLKLRSKLKNVMNEYEQLFFEYKQLQNECRIFKNIMVNNSKINIDDHEINRRRSKDINCASHYPSYRSNDNYKKIKIFEGGNKNKNSFIRENNEKNKEINKELDEGDCNNYYSLMSKKQGNFMEGCNNLINFYSNNNFFKGSNIKERLNAINDDNNNNKVIIDGNEDDDFIHSLNITEMD